MPGRKPGMRICGAIFFTSHVLHDVERIADRFGFIHQGELLTTRSPRDLFAAYCDEVGIEDPRLTALFSDLLDETTGVN